MKQTTFYTESKNKGYDVLYINSYSKKYTLYLSYKDYDINLYGETPKHLTRDEFDKLLNTYKKEEIYDLSNYNPDERESFYRDSHHLDDCVDLIEINASKKEYILLYDIDERCTDGYDVIGNEIFPTYVSSGVFEVVLAGLKASGYKEVEDFCDVLLR